MSLLVVRVTALVVLFLLTLFSGVVPVFIFRIWTKRKEAAFLDITSTGSGKSSDGGRKPSASSPNALLQIFMFFGGGVLFATCFIHLIPEVRENFDNYFRKVNKTNHPLFSNDTPEDDDHDHDGEDADHDHDHSGHSHKHSHGVPYVELAICGGFFVIYFLEELVHALIGQDHDHHKKEKKELDTEPSNSSPPSKMRNNLALGANVPPPACLLACNKATGSEAVSSCDSLENNEKGYVNYGIDMRNEPTVNNHYPIFHTQSCDALVGSKGSSTDSFSPKVSYSSATPPLLPASVRFIRGLVTIAAFSAHSIFDGVAIGLQESVSQVWTMFFAICVHKLVVAFAVGLELYEQTSSVIMTTVQMTIFSLMSPIGILIVILAESSMTESQSPVVILLSAVATGTILYIVFFEILQRDRSSSVSGLVQYLSMIMGFTLMLCVTLFIH